MKFIALILASVFILSCSMGFVDEENAYLIAKTEVQEMIEDGELPSSFDVNPSKIEFLDDKYQIYFGQAKPGNMQVIVNVLSNGKVEKTSFSIYD